MNVTVAEQLTEPLAHHAEGVVWSPDWSGPKWVDMLAGDVLSLDSATGEVRRRGTGSSIAAAVRPRLGGGELVVTRRAFTLWRGDELEWSSGALWSDDGRRFNEGGCDPSGAMLCGSMSLTATDGAAEVFRLRPDRSVERVFGDVTISNGLGFTANGDRMFYVDTPTRRIDVFEVDAEGALSARRPLVTITEGPGYPDGLCVDAEGGVWVALYGGSAVHHYDSSGELRDVVELPVRQVTSCTFGGPDLTSLFITTSRENLADDDQPLAGALFWAQPGAVGLPVLPFGG